MATVDLAAASLAVSTAAGGVAVSVPLNANSPSGEATASADLWPCDPYWAQTVFLMPFDGADGATVFTNCDVTGRHPTWTKAGQAQLDTAWKKFGTASLLLDGNGDFIYTTDSNDTNFDTGDFTVEAHFRIAGPSGTRDNVSLNKHMQIVGTNAGSTGWGMNILGDTTDSKSGVFLETKTSGVAVSSTIPIALEYGRDYFLSYSRIAGVLYTHLDGQLIKSHAFTANVQGGTNGLIVGSSRLSGYFRYFNGWVDNVRITKGVGRYGAEDYVPPQKAFSRACHSLAAAAAAVSTATGDLTGYTPEPCDPHWDLVVAQLHMDGTDSSTTIVDEKGHTFTVADGAQLKTAQKQFGTASLYVDGTNDCISCDHADFALGTGDLTIDIATMPITGGGNYGRLLQIGPNNTAGGLWIVKDTSNPPKIFVQGHNGSTYINLTNPYAATELPFSEFSHVELSRDSSGWRLRINGNTVSADGAYGSYDVTQTLLSIGANTAGGEGWYGYIDEVRITKGAVRNNGDFAGYAYRHPNASCASPAGDCDPYWNSVSSLLMFEGANNATATTDEKGNIWAFSGNAQISSAWSSMGSTSLLLDGTGDFISTPDAAKFELLGYDWTIEMTVKPTAFPALNNYAYLLSKYSSANDTRSWAIALHNEGGVHKIHIALSNIGTAYTAVASYAHGKSAGTPFTIAFSRSGDVVYGFVDGTLVGSFAYTGSIFDSDNPVVIGRQHPDAVGSDYNGYIDNVRLTVGAARYTDSYVVSASEFSVAACDVSQNLETSATVVASANGDLSLTVPLSATALAQALAAAGLSNSIALAADALNQAAAPGALTVDSAGVDLAATAAALAAAIGELTIHVSLAGTPIAEAAAPAALDVVAAPVDLAGNAAAVASALGTLDTAIPLTGAGLTVSSASGNLIRSIALLGAAANASSATGGLDVSVTLSGAALVQMLAAAALASSPISVAGGGVAEGTGSGNITLHMTLSGAAVAEAVASGNLAALGILKGTPEWFVYQLLRSWVVADEAPESFVVSMVPARLFVVNHQNTQAYKKDLNPVRDYRIRS